MTLCCAHAGALSRRRPATASEKERLNMRQEDASRRASPAREESRKLARYAVKRGMLPCPEANASTSRAILCSILPRHLVIFHLLRHAHTALCVRRVVGITHRILQAQVALCLRWRRISMSLGSAMWKTAASRNAPASERPATAALLPFMASCFPAFLLLSFRTYSGMRFLPVLAVALLTLAIRASAAPLMYEGTDGPAKGKHIVLIASDPEYKSEEALPKLGAHPGEALRRELHRALRGRSQDGQHRPGNSNIPGTEALKTADLMVIFTRFQELPAEQMQPIVDYLERGGPVVGLRTATHGFQIPEGEPLCEIRLPTRARTSKAASAGRCSARRGSAITGRITNRARGWTSCRQRRSTRS